MSSKRTTSPTIVEALKSLLMSGQVGTHHEIRQVLEQQGYQVNQSKISRLLRKIGAVKVSNDDNQIIYSLPKDPAPPSAKYVLSHLVISIDANETLIVIRTNPGSASLIARLLDHHCQELNILGTVAGDDTIFIAPTAARSIEKIKAKVKLFLAEAR